MMRDKGSAPEVRPDLNLPESGEVVRLPDGRVVERTVFTNGNVQDTAVSPGDFPDAPLVKD